MPRRGVAFVPRVKQVRPLLAMGLAILFAAIEWFHLPAVHAYWVLATGYWLLDTGYWLLATGYYIHPVKRKRFALDDAVLFENEDFLLINKPPFIATLEDRNVDTNILAVVRETYPDAQVGHRLDKDTSGVLAIALNPEAYRHISMQLEHREVTKVYHAIVEGAQRFDNQQVDAPILKQSDGRVKISHSGKAAETWFTSVESFKGYTLVECRPVTGRMHQIRIHLSLLGASIAGDGMYGGKPVFLSALKRSYNLKKETEEEPIMKRMALHAFSLEFLGLDGKKVKVEAPYPKDFKVLLKQLQANAR